MYARDSKILWYRNKAVFRGSSPTPFSAVYGEHVGLFSIDTLDMIEGDLPPRARRLVNEWAKKHQDELKKMWDSQKFRKLPPLE